MNTDDWPSHSEELDRKVLDVLRRHIEAYDDGKIGPKAMIMLVGALYDTTSGLIPKATMDLMASIHKDLRNALAA